MTVPAPKRSRAEKIRNLLAGLFSASVTLAAAEWAYSQFESPYQVMNTQNLHRFVDYDPQLGWKNTRDAEGIFLIEKTPTLIHNNHEGMRYREFGEKKGFRVAVQGDSVAWGYGINVKDRFSERVENDLNIEMLNFSVVGYGPVQQLLQLDDILPYKPTPNLPWAACGTTPCASISALSSTCFTATPARAPNNAATPISAPKIFTAIPDLPSSRKSSPSTKPS